MADDHFPNMLLPVQLMEVRDTRNFGDIGKVLSQSEHEVVPIARSVPQGNRINTIWVTKQKNGINLTIVIY